MGWHVYNLPELRNLLNNFIMEDLSVIYEDVDIRVWADNVREMKIRELRETIEDHVKYKEKADEYGDPERYKEIVDNEIKQLEEKLIILERK